MRTSALLILCMAAIAIAKPIPEEYMSQGLRLRDTEYALKARNNNGHVSARADAESIVTRRDASSYHEKFGLGARDLDDDILKRLAARSLVRRKVQAVPDPQGPSMQDTATMTQDTGGGGASAVGAGKTPMGAQISADPSSMPPLAAGGSAAAANGLPPPTQDNLATQQTDLSGGDKHPHGKHDHGGGKGPHPHDHEHHRQGPHDHEQHHDHQHEQHPDGREHGKDRGNHHHHRHHGPQDPQGNHGHNHVNGDGVHQKNRHGGTTQTPPPTQDGASGTGGDPVGNPPVTTASGVSGSGPSADAP